jgi:hypothetical protein
MYDGSKPGTAGCGCKQRILPSLRERANVAVTDATHLRGMTLQDAGSSERTTIVLRGLGKRRGCMRSVTYYHFILGVPKVQKQ